MEFSQKDVNMTRGLGILLMVAVHVFAKKGADVYGSPLLWVKDGVTLVYYIGFLGGITIPIYCFCTGYSLFRQSEGMEGRSFYRRALARLLRFVINFWIVCILFTIVGFFFDPGKSIPGSPLKFICNFFMMEHTYNGAWWFCSTYVMFTLLSPLYLKLVKKLDSRIVFVVFAGLFCVYYLCNMMRLFEVTPYYWGGFLARKLSDLWFLSFFYVEGMLIAKENMMVKVRNRFGKIKGRWLLTAILALSLLACFVEKSVSMYFLAIFYFFAFHLWKKSERTEKFFLFWGKHSTNIWLVHMFFYLHLFTDLVFVVKYPLFYYSLLMGISLICSVIISKIYERTIKSRPVKKLLSMVAG